MLNEQGVREQLREVNDALAKMDDERNALQSIKESLLRWLDLHGAQVTQLPLDAVKTSNGKMNGHDAPFKPLGSMTLAEAVLRTLRNREGQPMNTSEILETAQGMGAVTKAKNPGALVEWVIYDLSKKRGHPIKKKKPHVYVYHAPKRTESDDARAARDPFGLRSTFVEVLEQSGSDL